MGKARFGFGVLAIAAAVACGSGGGGGDAGSNDGGGADGGPSSDSGTPGKTRYFASFTLTSGAVTQNMVKTETYYASASFQDTSALAPLLDCGAPATDGACTITTCTRTDASATPEAGVGAVPGGDVTITAAQTLQLTSANGYVANGVGALYAGGQDVTVKVAGAAMGAPAWQDTFKAAAFPTVTAPAFPSTGPLVVDRTQPLPVAWSNGGAGDVRVQLVAPDGAGGSTVVACVFASSSGAGTVPATALAKLPATQKGAVSINGDVSRTQVVGDWTFAITASSFGNVPSGAYAAALLTVQ